MGTWRRFRRAGRRPTGGSSRISCFQATSLSLPTRTGPETRPSTAGPCRLPWTTLRRCSPCRGRLWPRRQAPGSLPSSAGTTRVGVPTRPTRGRRPVAGEGDAGCGRRPAAGRDRFGKQRDVHPAGRHPVHLPRVWRGPDGHGAQVDSSSHNLWVDDSTTSSTGSTNNYCIQGASSGSDLKATLVWSDKPGSPSSGVALVNDLTLFMGTDDNTVTGNWRNKKDTRNTVEVATIAASQISSGTEYKIQVKGVNVPSGPQKYALVITGSFPSVSPSGCTYEFADTLEDQSDSESFPLGPAVGIGAAGLAGGLLVMLSLLFFKDKTTLPRLCAAFQGAQGGGGGGHKKL